MALLGVVAMATLNHGHENQETTTIIVFSYFSLR